MSSDQHISIQTRQMPSKVKLKAKFGSTVDKLSSAYVDDSISLPAEKSQLKHDSIFTSQLLAPSINSGLINRRIPEIKLEEHSSDVAYSQNGSITDRSF